MRKLLLGIFIGFGCVGVSLSSWANEPAAKVSEFDALGIELPVLRRSVRTVQHVRSLVREWDKLWKKNRTGQAKGVLKELHELRLNSGYSHFVSLTSVLLKRASDAEQEGHYARARYLYEQATHFSPSSPTPQYRLSWVILRSDPSQLYRSFKAFWKGLKLHRFDIFGVTVWIVNCAWFLAWLLGCTFGLFWLVLLIRSLRSFQSDFRDLFPDGVTSFQIQLLSLFLIFLPLLMGAGIVETLLCWILISWFYQTKTERVLTTLGLLLLSATPYAANWVGRLASLSDSTLASVYKMNTTEWGARELKRVTNAANRSKDETLLWSLGLYYKRRGQLTTARAYYKRAYQKRRNPALLINLANIDFIEQKAESAYNKYRKALRSRGLPAGQYNLSLMYQHSHSTDVVPLKVDALTAARRGGGERIEQFIKQSKQQINRYVMDIVPSQIYYLRQLLVLRDQTALRQRLWSYAATWLPLSIAPWLGIGMAFLLWLLFPLVGRFFCGTSCTRCGCIVGRREQQMGAAEGECTQCHQLTAKTEGVSPERRVRKEFEIQKFKRRRSWVMLASALFIGVGQLLLKKSSKAFFLFLVLSTLLFIWMFQAPLLVHPFHAGGGRPFWLAIAVTVCAAILYIRSVREILSHR